MLICQELMNSDKEGVMMSLLMLPKTMTPTAKESNLAGVSSVDTNDGSNGNDSEEDQKKLIAGIAKC
jgi:hypothetical protein